MATATDPSGATDMLNFDPQVIFWDMEADTRWLVWDGDGPAVTDRLAEGQTPWAVVR
jgi:hypothetical protein